MERVLSGMRPTGKTHLGHLHGVLRNWRDLQDRYECFYFVADWHALTSEYKEPEVIKESISEMVIDWLAVGLDPERSTLFIQSWVKEHAELHLLFSMITPLGWLERNPTYKEQQEELKGKDLGTYGFLGYPVLQAADILIYKAQYVPVGKDQLPHLELTREIARRFNYLYGEVFPEPQALLTEAPHIPGIDGKKMSKSYNNAIYLSDPPEVIAQKISVMFTDPQRGRRTDPGRPELCPVFALHRLHSSQEKQREIEVECRRAGIGCVDCKRVLTENLLRDMAPLQQRRADFAQRLRDVREILQEGSRRAREIASRTMEEVRRAMSVDW
ncbi:MAG: tryptophan--tRNA ligase [Deltaproteobacteria bacterium]|nr:MAG: tryptophan--tRNA ligase [Deltaproteobacteria bacterium]